MFIECKGWHRDLKEALSKLLKVRRDNPGIDLRILWQHAGMKIGKTMEAWQWAEKHGFKWAEGKVPKAWLEECKYGSRI